MPVLKVEGMQCGHCKKSVEEAVSAIPGVKCATADLERKEVRFEEADPGQPVDMASVSAVISDLGFTPGKA